METKTGYDIHMHRNPSGGRKTSLLNPFGPSRKNSVSKGLASTTFMNRLPSPKTPPIPEVTAPQTPVHNTDTLRLTWILAFTNEKIVLIHFNKKTTMLRNGALIMLLQLIWINRLEKKLNKLWTNCLILLYHINNDFHRP